MSELMDNSRLDSMLIAEYQGFCRINGLPELEISTDLSDNLCIQIKAFIAEQIWDEESYFKAIAFEQPTILKSIEAIENYEVHWEKLTQRRK